MWRVVFRNYQDMTGVDRLNIHECQNVCRFIDGANRPFASDQFTENAGFQINCRHFGPIFILYHSHNITNIPRWSRIARCPLGMSRPLLLS